jgi:hypothetical protein
VRERRLTPFNSEAFLRQRGLTVTICIAASAELGGVVAVSDLMISFDDQIPAPDARLYKQNHLCNGWMILFSTDRITRVAPIIQRVRQRLPGDGPQNGSTVRDTVCEAYRDAVNEEATRRYLWPLGIHSLDEFRDKGLTQLGSRTFANIRRKIERCNLRIHFLVIGHGPDSDRPQIYEIENPGIYHDHQYTGYWAIGSGTAMALASITSRPMNCYHVDDVVFRVCEAKFACETATGVGKSTTVTVLEPNGDLLFLSDETIAKIKDIWKTRAQAPSSPNALTLINRELTRGRQLWAEAAERRKRISRGKRQKFSGQPVNASSSAKSQT